jgi:hypothetical protein
MQQFYTYSTNKNYQASKQVNACGLLSTCIESCIANNVSRLLQVSKLKPFILLILVLLGGQLGVFAQNTLDNVGLTASSPSHGAYSLRKLSSSYSGNALLVRRSSDNATQNIGFLASGYLDTASLKTFVGAGNGFVNTWYDQSGNLRDALQPTLANQPRIVNAGVIQRMGGVPAIFFTGTSFLTHNSLPTTGYTGFTINIVARWTTIGNTIGTIQALLDNNHTGSQGFVIQDRPDLAGKPITCGIAATPAGGGVEDNIQTGNGTSRILTFTGNNTTLAGLRDGNVYATRAISGTNYTLQSRFVIGAWHNNGSISRFTTGNIAEVVVIPSSLSSTDRTNLECNQSAYFSSPLTPPAISLGASTPISVGTTTAILPYSISTATHYSITWDATAASAGFVNVGNTTLPAGSISVAVPAVGPVGGQSYTGVLTVTNSCTGLSTNYGFTIFITGNNVLDNVNLTAANYSSVAYGLRKLSSAYTGPGLQIRRSSDGELRDVYFDGTSVLSLNSLVSAAGGGVATATTLSSWIGASSGTVAIWYDQSGQWRNAYQNIVANQPRVINAGVIETQNGKPAV